MGCDIHLYVERRTNGKWESADKWTPDKYSDEPYGRKPMVVDYDDSFYNGRNYNLFAILADVRNGVGFAGVKTGAGFVPISDPRGLPTDVTSRIKEISDEWGCDGHSHSHVTLAELLEYDWTQNTIISGWVDAFTFWKWTQYKRRQGEAPESWCGAVSGRGVKHITCTEMENALSELKPELAKASIDGGERIINERGLGQTYCEFQIEQPYYRCCRQFWSDVIPRLLRLGKPSDVRLVYWFDN
jgi:hypothetical protein